MLFLDQLMVKNSHYRHITINRINRHKPIVIITVFTIIQFLIQNQTEKSFIPVDIYTGSPFNIYEYLLFKPYYKRIST